MKTAGILGMVLLAVLACGCTGTNQSPSGAPSQELAPATPDLIGTWTGTMLNYDSGIGSTDSGNATIRMVVSNQKGRFFTGNLEWTNNGTASGIPIAGVIGRNGRTFTLIEKGNDYLFGEILATDEIELTNLNDASSGRMSITTMTRS